MGVMKKNIFSEFETFDSAEWAARKVTETCPTAGGISYSRAGISRGDNGYMVPQTMNNYYTNGVSLGNLNASSEVDERRDTMLCCEAESTDISKIEKILLSNGGRHIKVL